MTPPTDTTDRPETSRPARATNWTPERLSKRRGEQRNPSETPLLWVALAVGSGLVFEPGLNVLGGSPGRLFLLASCLLLAWLGAWRLGRNQFAAFLLLGAIGSMSAGWSGVAWRWFPSNDLGLYANRDAEPVCFDAVAISQPVVYPAQPASPFRAIPSTERSVLEVKALRLRDATSWIATDGLCEVTFAGAASSSIQPGDHLRVFGQLRRPTPALNPGQRDSARAARAMRELCVIWSEAPECLIVEKAIKTWGSLPSRFATDLRATLVASFDRSMRPDQAAMVRAMLLGDTSSLPRETVEAFRRTGMLHLLVVSGLHVGLVAGLFLAASAIGILPRRAALIAAVLATIVYAAATGGRPPAVRAAVVVCGACAAMLIGRGPIGANSLAGAAVTVFVASPGAWQSVGTQLSFLAAATLLGVAHHATLRQSRYQPPLDRLVTAYRPAVNRWGLHAAVWSGWILMATTAVWVVAGPLIVSEFHLVSPAAIPLSLATPLLIWATVAGGMLVAVFELIASAAGWLVGEPLGNAIAWLTWLPAQFAASSAAALVELVQWTASSDYAGFYHPGPYRWWSTAWLGWVGMAMSIDFYWRRGRRLLVHSGLLLVVSAFAPVASSWIYERATDQRELEIHFLAVGHGSAVLIETPEGHSLLYDAGALGSPERTTDTIARALWSRGIDRLDGVFLSHPDVDHYNALPGLFDRFTIDQVWCSPLMFPRSDDRLDYSGPAALKRLLRHHSIPIRELQTSDRLRIGSTTIEVLHPDPLGLVGSDNANSLVLMIEHAGKRALLTGDLESPGLDLLLEQEPYPCDLLAAPHHGSGRSNPPGLAAWCKPSLVVVSSGARRPTTVDAYLQQGAQVANTHDAGLVSVGLSEKGVNWQLFSRSWTQPTYRDNRPHWPDMD